MIHKIIFSEDIKFPSERKSVKLIEPIIASLRHSIHLSDELYYNILIACTEAINNAIIHGNQCQLEKIVNFSISGTELQIDISIKDQGCGFNSDNIADPRDPNNLMKTGGRGVFLIKELSDQSEFISNENGSIIKMTFFTK